MHYTVEPGLYALGEPEASSAVLVTANYKMSFDALRSALPGLNAWILVVDTQGINVWCAAGKGTFGTEELVARVRDSRLQRLVTHRRLVLPQLAAPGVAAHKVREACGYRVIYGPIRAKDLPAFLDRGLHATPEMRRKSFELRERAVLIPVELVSALKGAAAAAAALFFLSGVGGDVSYWNKAMAQGGFAVVAVLAAVAAGVVATPLLLPWLPARAFSVKGLLTGAAAALLLLPFRAGALQTPGGRLELLAWLCLIPALSSYLGLNFTGASTYTSLSGVKREMRLAVPLQIAAGVIGLALWLGSRFVA